MSRAMWLTVFWVCVMRSPGKEVCYELVRLGISEREVDSRIKGREDHLEIRLVFGNCGELASLSNTCSFLCIA